jgi:hypothetical protein
MRRQRKPRPAYPRILRTIPFIETHPIDDDVAVPRLGDQVAAIHLHRAAARGVWAMGVARVIVSYRCSSGSIPSSRVSTISKLVGSSSFTRTILNEPLLNTGGEVLRLSDTTSTCSIMASVSG